MNPVVPGCVVAGRGSGSRVGVAGRGRGSGSRVGAAGGGRGTLLADLPCDGGGESQGDEEAHGCEGVAAVLLYHDRVVGLQL